MLVSLCFGREKERVEGFTWPCFRCGGVRRLVVDSSREEEEL